MTSGVTNAIVGDWAGVIELAGEAIFAKVAWRAGDPPSGSLDLPGELTFRRPVVDVRVDGDRLRFASPTEGAPLVFDCRGTDGRIKGTVRRDELQGSFRLSPLAPLTPARAAGCVGTYRLDPVDVVLVGLRGDGQDKAPFYARGDRLVPLYPLSPTTLLSDLAETLTFVGNEAGMITGARWRQHDRADVFASRVDLYREEAVRFHNGEVALAGTLLTPFGRGPHPAVVIMHGSIPSERDFYRVYADHFTRRGIAALIYDKRGFGASGGNARSTIAERAEDALSGLRYVQGRPEIDPRKVGLWGFSNSTWSLPVAAVRSTDVAFLVATGAAGVSMAQAEIHRRTWELREWGVAEDTLVGVARAWGILFEYGTTGRWDGGWDEEWGVLVERLQRDETLRAIPLADYVRANPLLAPIPPLVSVQELQAMPGGSAPDMSHDPSTDYERVACPVLFLVGAQDANVPAGEGASRVAAALGRGGNRDYTVKVVPNAAHALNVPYSRVGGMSTEEAGMRLHNFRFVPGILALMSDWILERVAAAS
jgi:dienelactone hydrolase